MMDRDTLLTFKALWTYEPSPTRKRLERLTPDEQALYEDLLEHRLGDHVRLEQERIGFDRVSRRLDLTEPSPTARE